MPEADVQRLIGEIERAKTIQLYAMGRMQASMRGFAMRLKAHGARRLRGFRHHHARHRPGRSAHRQLRGDGVEVNVIKLAKQAGARVCTIGAHPENEHGRLADLTVLVPGQIFGTPPEVRSIQPMASLLEQALFLFEDIVVMLLIEKRCVSMAEMQRRHTNLEGVMGEFA